MSDRAGDRGAFRLMDDVVKVRRRVETWEEERGSFRASILKVRDEVPGKKEESRVLLLGTDEGLWLLLHERRLWLLRQL